jgi:general L-amino acid transport system permease protein
LGQLLLRLVIYLIIVAALGFGWRYMRDVTTKRDTGSRPPPWRDVRVLAVGIQVIAVGLLYLLGAWLWRNFGTRTDDIGLDPFDFTFLDQPSGISIADSALDPNSPISSALRNGVKNTFLMIIIGIPLSIILGTLLGISRLSDNWLLSKIATGYVEFFRNIPPLLIIVATWSLFLNGFPAERESWTIGKFFIFNNKRFAAPSIAGQDNFAAYRWLMLASIVLAAVVWVWRTRQFDRTGTPHRRVLWSLGTIFGVGIIGYFVLGQPIRVSTPEIVDRVYLGGIKMQMPYAAGVFALTLYTASHIAEIVRGSILSVDRGQVEAGNALALSGFHRYRFVVLPQAFRVAFPPLINQFLNFTKNSSLVVAIGFADITSIVINLFGQSRPAPQLLFILMGIYLLFSLILSAIGNFINGRLAIAGR